MTDYDIDHSIMIQIADSERVGYWLWAGDGRARGEAAITLSEIQSHALPLVDCHDVQESIPVEVRGLGHSDLGIGRAKWSPARIGETATMRSQIDIALAAISMRNNEVDDAVAVEVGRSNSRR